jgi:cytochrome P450
MSTDWRAVDYFTDPSLVEDPYPYFDELRATCPVQREPHHGVVAVSGYDEVIEIYRDPETFSSCNAVTGPFPGFADAPAGEDINDFITQHRHELPMWEHMVTMDPPEHTIRRALLMRLLTSKRLRENEDFMWRLADRQIDEFVANGSCEFIREYSQPFALLVIADLLGVPEEKHDAFRAGLYLTPGAVDAHEERRAKGRNPLEFLDTWFSTYINDRRLIPRNDVLTDLALARFPDGSTPDVIEVVRTATFLFAAGQETTARLLATALKHLAEHPDVQDQLREDKELIPNFIEEALRIESPVKSDFRMARRTASIGGVEIQAGTCVMLLNGAANRDPDRFENAQTFQVDRYNARAHIAFGRGVHTCPGAPLARAEGRISIERILDRLRDIRLSDEHHGSPGNRRFRYTPTYVLRGLDQLHLTFEPAR